MIFDFMHDKDTDLTFEKLGPNSYKFGTRKISAKL
jgi:hypothetical protein